MKGKFKIKYLWFILLLLLIAALLSVPRVEYRRTAAVAERSAYPELETACQDLQEKYGDLILGEEIEILRIGNILGSCDYYVLPCYRAVVRTVPQNGQAFWETSLHMVTACSKENSLAAKLFKLDVRNVRVEVETGAETFLSSRVEMNPSGRVYDLKENAQVLVQYSVSTSMGTEEENQSVSASFVWNYDLYGHNKLTCKYRNVTLTQDYLVNAI